MKRNRRNRNDNTRKERAIMIASSVFVLSALTMTGVYVKQNSESNSSDGYHIDFSVLEENASDKYDEIAKQDGQSDLEQLPLDQTNLEDDLDYDVNSELVGSGTIEIPGLTDKTSQMEGSVSQAKLDEIQGILYEMENADQKAIEQDAKVIEQDAKPSYSFGDSDKLLWPVEGSVLISYSMDKTIYFSTLDQYKYNPAMIISAVEGNPIKAAAAGQVLEVYTDDEIGQAVTMDIGNGYTITYGQLSGVNVSEGTMVEAGENFAFVAEPTIYYSVEGANVYFELNHEGTPVDPSTRMSE